MNGVCLEYNKLGLFVLPHETALSFIERAEKLVNNGSSSASSIVQELFDVDPGWVKVVYSKKELYPWEAGCTWLDEVPWIQLHPKFLTQDALYGIYSHKEVLAHEYVHVVRASLNSHKFEELFAYLVSTGRFSAFRKLFGPLFSEPRDSLIFLAGIVFGLVFSPLISVVIILLFLLRLSIRWWQYHRCKQHLGEFMEQKAILPLMVRLTDEEIILFSKLSAAKVNAYINEQAETNFRWQLLDRAYIHPS